MNYIRSFWGARDVLRQLVARDVKLRYKPPCWVFSGLFYVL
jgi:ABC-type polysaccharide/polyol phosphate export permease